MKYCTEKPTLSYYASSTPSSPGQTDDMDTDEEYCFPELSSRHQQCLPSLAEMFNGLFSSPREIQPSNSQSFGTFREKCHSNNGGARPYAPARRTPDFHYRDSLKYEIRASPGALTDAITNRTMLPIPGPTPFRALVSSRGRVDDIFDIVNDASLDKYVPLVPASVVMSTALHGALVVPFDANEVNILAEASMVQIQQTKIYQCALQKHDGSLCGQRGAKQTVKRHILSVHMGIRGLMCEHPDKNGSNRICGQLFSQKSSLKIHIDTIHLKIKRHGCKYCDARFSDPSGRNKHVSASHPDALTKKRTKDPYAHLPDPTPSHVICKPLVVEYRQRAKCAAAVPKVIPSGYKK